MRMLSFILVGIALGAAVVAWLFMQGPYSLKAAYARDAAAAATHGEGRLVTEADLGPLPTPVRRYLEGAGVVGRPRPTRVWARMHGRIRGGVDRPWMEFAAEQQNTLDTKTRLYYLDAAMYGLPVKGYHRYVGSEARMDITLMGLVTVQRAAGAEFTRAETVTLFNDMCLLAPATLLDPAIGWTPIDDRTARAAFTNAGHTVTAELSFNEAGELVDFWSDDRLQSMPDGTMRPLRWSTPLGGYRAFGPYRLASTGEARWHEPGGGYAYVELTIDEVAYDTASAGGR